MPKAKEAVSEAKAEEKAPVKKTAWTYIGGGGRVVYMNPEDEQPRSPEEVAKVVAEADKAAKKSE